MYYSIYICMLFLQLEITPLSLDPRRRYQTEGLVMTVSWHLCVYELLTIIHLF